jgi:choline dehydrogenase-like flavoprotein
MSHTTAFTPAERNLLTLLRILAFAFGLLGIYYSTQFPEAGAGIGLLAFAAWLSSGDVRRFRVMIWGVFVGCAFGAAASLLIALTSPPPTGIALGIHGMAFAVAGLLVLWMLRAAPANDDTVLPWKTQKPRLRVETVTAILCGALAVGIVVVMAFTSSLVTLFATFGATADYVPMAALYFVLIALCAMMVAFDVRANSEYLLLLIIGALLGIGGHLLRWSTPAPLLIAEVVLLVGAWLLRAWLHNSLIDYLRFFTPGQFWALAALSDGLIEGGTKELLKPHEIALRVDNHLGSFPAPKLALSRYATMGMDVLIPLIFNLRPPLSYLHLQERSEFLSTLFKVDLIEARGIFALEKRIGITFISELVEGIMRFVMQFAYLGYYSAPNVQKEIGYTPFSERMAGKSVNLAPKRRYTRPLNVLTPDDIDQQGLDTLDEEDIVIIGSGAAGSLLAERMLALHPTRRVLLLEKGRHLDPNDFSEDEIEMIGKLYGDNALQVTASLRFSILQGSCVGGTTVANNAISFETPPHIPPLWNAEHGAGLNIADFYAAQAEVMKRMQIEPIDTTVVTRPLAEVVNPITHVLQKGIDAEFGTGGYEYKPVKANIVDCLGCGYCNMGCKYGRKLSMLDEVLPAAQQQYGDRLQILAEAEAIQLKADSSGAIENIVVRLRGKRDIHIRKPKTVIVSGGTIASSWLLLRSGIGKNLPIGRRLSFNMGSPLHARFPKPMRAYEGMQMSHYLRPTDETEFIFETWFNPPVAHALVMPGWMDKHFDNMQKYDHMVSMGVVVGTEARDATYIRPATLFPGSAEVVYEPTERDLDKLVTAMHMMGRVLLEAGADEVLASTRTYHSYKPYAPGETVTRAQAAYHDKSELGFLEKLVKTDDDILLNSAHPQGGNPLGTVLDADFRVRGYRNLYVCDASVFPTSITVNPQLTVMTMAWYAADRIQ